MRKFLILDKDDIAINIITESDARAVRAVAYDGPFWQGGKFDGVTVSDPRSDEVVSQPAPTGKIKKL